MTRALDVDSVRREIDQIVTDVAERGDSVVVDRDGHAVAAIVPMHVYEHFVRDRERFFDHIDEVSRRVNMDPDEADELVREAIAWVRSQNQS